MSRRVIWALTLGLALVGSGAWAHDLPAANDYSNPDYLQHDIDNYFRARGAGRSQQTSTTYGPAFVGAASDSMLRATAQQINDARYGRFYGGFSHYVPTYGATGDPEIYFAMTPRRVHFLARTGAKLQGHVWGYDGTARRPGVVITPGSIQGTDQMYWWAAQALARAGYEVLSFDAQGQGQSETFGHAPGSAAPTGDGVPFQQEANFVDGTVDALRFFRSTPQSPYVPVGWSATDVAAARAAAQGEELDWVNPGHEKLDRATLGIAGHSLGARAVSVVQQCSDRGKLWRTLPACAGQSFPIRAVVGWDTLSASVQPVVPGLDLRADGYFLSPTATPQAPDPAGTLSTFAVWRKAGLDTQVVVIRGGTHLDFSHVPYHGPSTRYGPALSAYYTVAWMDRYLARDAATRLRGYRALFGGPVASPELAHSANHFSARSYSAAFLHSVNAEGGRPVLDVTDLRASAKRSRVGDWAGANADKVGSELPL